MQRAARRRQSCIFCFPPLRGKQISKATGVFCADFLSLRDVRVYPWWVLGDLPAGLAFLLAAFGGLFGGFGGGCRGLIAGGLGGGFWGG